jgi:hypothetical protein
MKTAGNESVKNAKQPSGKPPVEEESGSGWQFVFVMAVVFLGVVALVVKSLLG